MGRRFHSIIACNILATPSRHALHRLLLVPGDECLQKEHCESSEDKTFTVWQLWGAVCAKNTKRATFINVR